MCQNGGGGGGGVGGGGAFYSTGYNISIARKLQFCTQPFEILQGQIAFKNMVQSTNFLERSIKIGPLPERCICFRANSRTGYKKLVHFLNRVSVLEQFFFRTGWQFEVPGSTYLPKKYPSAPPLPGPEPWLLFKKAGPVVNSMKLLQCSLQL